jgi:putative Holliday junction resolvase
MIFNHSNNFTALLPPSGRLLGLDVGEKTIGLALSDGLRMIASPHMTITRSKFSKDLAQLKAITHEHQIVGLVIGNPINMDGTSGQRVQSTQTFISNLKKHIALPMLLWDERLTTMAVNRMMEKEADLSRKRRDELVDKLAASYMLQGCLDRMKGLGVGD